MADSALRTDNIGVGLWNAHWWDFLLRGLIAVAFGLVLFLLPGLSLLTFIMLFAAFAFVIGVLLLLQAVTIKDGRWWVRIIEGLIGIAAAASVILWPHITLLTFAYIIAFYWIFTGILDVITAIEARKVIHGEWLLIAGGICYHFVAGSSPPPAKAPKAPPPANVYVAAPMVPPPPPPAKDPGPAKGKPPAPTPPQMSRLDKSLLIGYILNCN